MNFKTIHDIHHCFDHALQPVETISSGDTRCFDIQDASGGLIQKESQADILTRLPHDALNPVCGPLFIEDADPGDVIEIELEDFEPGAWGWTGLIPGFGLLADDFTQPWLKISEYDSESVYFRDDIVIPFRPFAGTIGLAPAEPGQHSIVPPRLCGGNLDIRDLVKGSKLYLPVQVRGGLLSIGDTHACQGDGEVCGTAVETGMKATATIRLHKGDRILAPMFDMPPVERDQSLNEGFIVTTGVGADLMQGARDAVRFMMDRLVKKAGMEEEMAYALCSVAGQLRISEIVDQPNWVVSCYMPKAIFKSTSLKAI
ncbi:acetamidase/formamidase family protein [Kushneria phosphatilytica]|uniref:Acetamidase/formamidase family protein n=2 Tax=Kushneria phosphatilytica TaxID=657387 RepID=A0A1S1NYP6_9GAMM|nr:acetamidase/formamidase family protein [Kushneria phosphatilytica]OHV12801.1 acetamidase [Kushneria phosphatilytica]QEL12744.1 acetamidase/formamidase family protein [Kushneria phosphatilytica]